jgi:hypothetical protein
MAYYFDHQPEIDAKIAGELEETDRAHQAAQDSPLRLRLRSKSLL